MDFKSKLSDYDKVEFEEYKKNYQKQNYRCQKDLGFLYDSSQGKLMDIRCKKWDCEHCRNIKRYGLYIEILKNVYCFDLDKHFVITSAGKDYRNNVNWCQSYYDMSTAWNKLKLVIEYKYGKLSYVVLPRSQKDGYCHYHILVPKYLDWKFLNEKRKKYNLGFVSIQKNKDLAEYLCNDYFKDNEWVIPEGIKHYRSSRDMILRNNAGAQELQFIVQGTPLDQVEFLVKKLFGGSFDRVDYEFRNWLNDFNNNYRRKNDENIVC